MGIRKYTQEDQLPLTLEELKTLSLFALHVSPTLEILTRADSLNETISDLELLTEMLLDKNFDFILGLNNITNATLLINVPHHILVSRSGSLQRLLNAAVQDKDLSRLKLGGIHVTISQSTDKFSNESEQIVSEIGKRTKFGVAVDDCRNECQTTSEYSAHEYVQKASYFVGGYKKHPRVPSLKLNLQELLDSQLREKRDLQLLYPNLRMISFRQNLFIDFDKKESETIEIPRYLRQVSHWIAFRNEYNISMFISGFDHSRDHSNPNEYLYEKYETGWWNISNYSDLSNVQVFTEKQSYYFRKSSWKPKFQEEVDSVEGDSPLSTIWIVFGVIIVVAVVTCLAAYRISTLQRKVRLLTKKEVNEFYEGTMVTANSEENTCVQEKFNNNFEIQKTALHLDDRDILGSGNFGLVYRVKLNEILVAVKVPRDNCSKETFRSMLHEVKILSYLGTHLNLVEFVGCYTKEIEDGVIYIATKLCERGSLQNYLKRELRANAASCGMEALIRFPIEIASGMEYISGKNVVHGDLSTRNILLDADLTCKIADFGLSRKMYEYGKYVKENQEPLPWRWMAYESLVDMEFTSKSDVWSFGVTLWEIFSLGTTPYPGLAWTVDFVTELKNGLRPGSPEYATEPVFSKMRMCWNLDSDTRPGFAELRKFFVQLRDEIYYSEL